MINNSKLSQQQQPQQAQYIIQNGNIYQLTSNFKTNTNININNTIVNNNNMILTNNNLNKVTVHQQPIKTTFIQPPQLTYQQHQQPIKTTLIQTPPIHQQQQQQQLNTKKIVYKADHQQFQQVIQQQYQQRQQQHQVSSNVIILASNKNDVNVLPPPQPTVVNTNKKPNICYITTSNPLTNKVAPPQITQPVQRGEMLNKAIKSANNQLETVKVVKETTNPIDISKLNQYMVPDTRVFKRLLKAPHLMKKKADGKLQQGTDTLTYKTVMIGSVEHIVLDNIENLSNFSGNIEKLKLYAYTLATRLQKPVTIPGFLSLKDKNISKNIDTTLDSVLKRPLYVNKENYAHYFEDKPTAKKQKESESRKKRKVDNEAKSVEKNTSNSTAAAAADVVNTPICSSMLQNDEIDNFITSLTNAANLINNNNLPTSSNNINNDSLNIDNFNFFQDFQYLDNLTNLNTCDLEEILLGTVSTSNFDGPIDPSIFLNV